MNIKIKTKYKIGQRVWYTYEDLIIGAKIVSITVQEGPEDIGGLFYCYNLHDDYDDYVEDMFEDELYETEKEAQKWIAEH